MPPVRDTFSRCLGIYHYYNIDICRKRNYRYFYTLVSFFYSPLARYIFHKHDDPLLKHEYDDNQRIEPVYYIPVIPMVLVNGADGIGTGWMTKIPNYNPREIIENLHRMMDGADPKPMVLNYLEIHNFIDALYLTIIQNAQDIEIFIVILKISLHNCNFCLDTVLQKF